MSILIPIKINITAKPFANDETMQYVLEKELKPSPRIAKIFEVKLRKDFER